jgi:hypothetical protein
MELNYKSLLAPEGFVAHWNEEIKIEDYHADKTAVNSSSLKKMLKSPLAFHESFYGDKKEPTEAMKLGTLAHMAILQGDEFKKRYAVMPAFESKTADGKPSESKNTKYYKDQVEAWRSSLSPESILVTQEDLDKLLGMVNSIKKHPEAMQLLSAGKPELSGYWRDTETGILCRMQADFISFNLGALVDVKTTSDCSESMFKKTIQNYEYSFQLVMYAEGIKHITGKYPEFMVWIAIENIAPYEVRVYQMSPQFEEIGKYQYRLAMNKLKECINSGKFESGQKEIEIITPDYWYLNQYESKI